MPLTSLQPSAGLDTYILSSTPTTNYVTATPALLGHGTAFAHLLLKFLDMNNGRYIPQNAVIESAVLSYWVASVGSATAAALASVYRLKIPWVASQATWNNWATSNSWSTAGGTGSTDSEQIDIGKIYQPTTQPANFECRIFLHAPTVQSMIANPLLNNGFLLKTDDTGSANIVYNVIMSEEATLTWARPRLQVAWHTPRRNTYLDAGFIPKVILS